ncbi:MAG: hypothetical protein P4L53_18775 [Candidatus Obscuribacterales bacterium]|nr:hypothetical protein [Candidatus Obscuribacterales bacterium]
METVAKTRVDKELGSGFNESVKVIDFLTAFLRSLKNGLQNA